MGSRSQGPDPVRDPGGADVDHAAIRESKKHGMNPPQKHDPGLGPTTAHRRSDPAGDAAPPPSPPR